MVEINIVQGFSPLKIKIAQFPDGFCLKILTCLRGFLDTFHIFFGFLCAQVSSGSCETESCKICNFVRKALESC